MYLNCSPLGAEKQNLQGPLLTSSVLTSKMLTFSSLLILLTLFVLAERNLVLTHCKHDPQMTVIKLFGSTGLTSSEICKMSVTAGETSLQHCENWSCFDCPQHLHLFSFFSEVIT